MKLVGLEGGMIRGDDLGGGGGSYHSLPHALDETLHLVEVSHAVLMSTSTRPTPPSTQIEVGYFF